MMRDHGVIGRHYAGAVTQIISGSIGFDDWEWGVDLFADDPLVFKKLIYEMRFDEAQRLVRGVRPLLRGPAVLTVRAAAVSRGRGAGVSPAGGRRVGRLEFQGPFGGGRTSPRTAHHRLRSLAASSRSWLVTKTS